MNTADADCRLDSFFNALLVELGDVYSDTPAKEFAVDRFRGRMRKRADFHKPELKAKAISDFISLNEEVGLKGGPTLDAFDINNASLFITTALERYTKSREPDSIQESFSAKILFDNWRFGPGASNGVKGTHAAEKIEQSMTCTTLAVPLVSYLRRTNPYFNCFDAMNGGGVTVVSGSRLEAVPKNEDTWRTIAIEPLGNMVLQLAAGRYLEDTLRFIGLDISTQQPKNKRLAMIGSVHDSLATIDMKSASDMISTELVLALLPKRWFDLLYSIRSSYCQVEGLPDVKLNMISTMGNGFTFPLMTLILTSLIYAYRCRHGGPNLFLDWKETAVFGDDVIVPVKECSGVCELFQQAGFVINTTKSFSEGPFRESCGGDYYQGVDVTPPYVRSLREDPDVYVAINQVLSWCGTHKVLLPATLIFLKKCLKRGPYLVPEWMSPFQGILTAQCSTRYKHLQLVVERKFYNEGPFKVMLAVAGYIESFGLDSKGTEIVRYTPRAKRLSVCVKDSRLPRGYLDGADPLTRTARVSSFVSILTEAIFR